MTQRQPTEPGLAEFCDAMLGQALGISRDVFSNAEPGWAVTSTIWYEGVEQTRIWDMARAWQPHASIAEVAAAMVTPRWPYDCGTGL